MFEPNQVEECCYRFQPDSCSLDGAAEQELSIHDGTVRDCMFLDDPRGNAVLVTAGAGDCRIHVTDTVTATVIQSMAGHSNHVLSLCTWSAGTVENANANIVVKDTSYQTPKFCRSCVRFGFE